jgi:hypothetical protein
MEKDKIKPFSQSVVTVTDIKNEDIKDKSSESDQFEAFKPNLNLGKRFSNR